MKTRFIVVEDADLDPCFSNAVCVANPDWEMDLHKIGDVASYERAITTLSNVRNGDLIAAFDLDYSNVARGVKHTLAWDEMQDTSKQVIPQQTKHGVNALLSLLKNYATGNCLIVVSSNFTGDGMDSGRALRNEIQKIARSKRPTAVIHTYFPGGPLTVGGAVLNERLKSINHAWNAFFGSMACRLRSSQNSGWFNDSGSPFPAHMIHAASAPDLTAHKSSIIGQLTPWLSSISDGDASTVQGCLARLFRVNGFGFYKHALQHVTGACALHCGRGNGKPLNMHGLALIACCYAGGFAAVFNDTSWPPDDSERLIEPTTDTTPSEDLLYLLVGKPTEQREAQPTGVFGILGIHDGSDGGQKGAKTVTSVALTTNSVKVTFGVKGTTLATKYNNGNAAGNAYSALIALRDTLLTSNAKVSCSGSDSEFILTIRKA